MSELSKLVPPLELCKKIPAGEFADSCFARPDIPGEPVHTRNGKVYEHLKRCGITYYPAPTLEEIIRKIRLDLLCGIEHHGDFYVSNRHIGCFVDERAATAAMKLWLELSERSEKVRPARQTKGEQQ